MTDEQIRYWFKDHAAIVSGDGIYHLIWCNRNNSSNYRIDYWNVPSHGLLMVTGDVGDAIYRWHPDGVHEIDFIWIAHLEADYFASKCQASEVGLDYKDWSPEKAYKAAVEWLKEAGEPSPKVVDEMGFFGELRSSSSSEQDFAQFISDNDFGADAFELMSAGKVISTRCRAHLIGLKMAVACSTKLGQQK